MHIHYNNGELVVAKLTMGDQKITSSTMERCTIIKALDEDTFQRSVSSE